MGVDKKLVLNQLIVSKISQKKNYHLWEITIQSLQQNQLENMRPNIAIDRSNPIE